jgi:hypothetical protein
MWDQTKRETWIPCLAEYRTLDDTESLAASISNMVARQNITVKRKRETVKTKKRTAPTPHVEVHKV